MESNNKTKGFSLGMALVTIGVVYGDIGTSPMYVMKSILAGNGGIGNVNEEFIVGSLSLIIWTITLLTTVKFNYYNNDCDNFFADCISIQEKRQKDTCIPCSCCFWRN